MEQIVPLNGEMTPLKGKPLGCDLEVLIDRVSRYERALKTDYPKEAIFGFPQVTNLHNVQNNGDSSAQRRVSSSPGQKSVSGL